MASSFNAYMAGVGTVAVAIVIGFGGGLLIAQRFGSETAVPEQSKIAKAKQDANKQAEIPQIPLSKPVVTENIGAAFNNQPLTPTPQSLASPPAAAQSALPPVHEQQQIQAAPERREAIAEVPPAEAPPPAREPVRNAEPAPAPRQQIAPVAPATEAPQPAKRRAEKAPPKPDRRQALKSDTQRIVEEESAAPEASTSESRGRPHRDKARIQEQRVDEDARRARARAITDDEEIEDVSSSDEPIEYRRMAPRPMMPPFFGLFGR